MPPRRAQSSAIVPTGSRDVWHDGPTRRRKQGGTKPSTERALVLRNGKEGINGSGEVAMFTKLFGREKLELLAGMSLLFDYAIVLTFRVAATYDATQRIL